MFRKQFRIKSNTQVKGSERKRIRSEIGNNFSELTDEDLNNLFPSKESITTMKIVTHCGETVMVYSVDRIPMVFEASDVMYPTVYMLWKFPNLLHTFTTHPVVFSKLLGGADLMLPGVVLEEPYTIKSFGNLVKGDLVSINLTDNRAPIAVGTAALSSFDMYMSAKRGKGVHVAHYNGDFLCANIKLCPPNLGPPTIMRIQDSDEEGKLKVDEMAALATADYMAELNFARENRSPDMSELCLTGETIKVGEDSEETYSSMVYELRAKDSGFVSVWGDELGIELLNSEQRHDCDSERSCEHTGTEMVEVATELSKEDCTDSEAVNSALSAQELMDKLMEYCFLKALKTTARKLTLPLLTSNFFKLHMIPACPKGESLEVKKSSYKKLSKFLKEMEGKHVIGIRELTKGVESIVSVNYSNPILKQFVEDSDDDDDEGSLEPSSAKATEVNEMFVINASTLPFFRTFGYRKGESLMATSIRQHLTDYVMKNGLQNSNDKRFVKLDHLLSSCLHWKEGEEITWKELMTVCIERMGNSYSIGQCGSVNKGKLKPIEITVATRTGNKKVTLISNLESYGINCAEFAKKCQHGVAASATITQLPGSKSSQVMVQGNQVIFLEKLLTGEYQIHKRFIRGLENAPKMKKPKQTINK